MVYFKINYWRLHKPLFGLNVVWQIINTINILQHVKVLLGYFLCLVSFLLTFYHSWLTLSYKLLVSLHRHFYILSIY